MSELYLIDDLFNTLVALEEYGMKSYSELAEKADSVEVQKLFKNLANQEADHKDYYLELRQKFDSTEDVDTEYSGYLNALIKNSFFRSVSTNDIHDIDEALKIAVLLEKETLLFLAETENVLGESSYKIFEKIKNEERRHLALILDIVDKRKGK